MTAQEAIDYIEQYTWSTTRLGLERTQALLRALGDPQKKLKFIHVAGSNGKGSTCAMLAAILQAAGYKTGLYISPYIQDFCERMQVNGENVPGDILAEITQRVKTIADAMEDHPSQFELVTAIALEYFHEAKCDIVVLEVGMGGALDSTNAIDAPEAAVITNIGLEHTEYLGNTLTAIAETKAGIIKPGVPVVIGEALPETRPIFEAMATENKAPIVFAEDQPEVLKAELKYSEMNYDTRSYGKIIGELCGNYQAKNANTILCAIRQLEDAGYMYRYTDDSKAPTKGHEIKIGFKNVCKATGLKGRWQVVSKSPTVVCDTGHNTAGWEYLSRQLNDVVCDNMYIVFGIVEDKDVDGVMALLPKHATYFFTKANNKRALSERVVHMMGQQLGLEGEAYPTVTEAYAAAKSKAEEGDFVFIGGSSYVVAEFLKNCV